MAKRKMPNKNTPRELREIPEEFTSLKSQDTVVDKITEVIVVNCATLNVRKEAQKRDNVLLVVPSGERLSLLKAGDVWSLVESIKRGKQGWVMSEFIKKVE